MHSSYDEVQGLINGYREEQQELIDHVISLSWHMRGGLSREEAWSLSFEERKRTIRFIEERVKAVEKTGLPIL